MHLNRLCLLYTLYFILYTRIMILFFYGEDTYRLKQKVRALKQKYIDASLGDTNLAILDGKTVTYDEVVRQVLAFPFLAKSRLVIIENIIRDGKAEVRDKLIDFLKKIPESTVLVFVEEGKPDKRTSLFKKLAKEKTQEVSPLDEVKVKDWIMEEVEDRGGSIERTAVGKLQQCVGNDLWRLSNEIDKLLAYNTNITVQNIELLVRSQTESDVFALIEAVSSKRKKQALFELHQLLDNGANELYILSMIIYQYRNLLIVNDEVARGARTHWDVAKAAKLHPFVAQKTMQMVRNYEFRELKQIYAELMNFDVDIKTGKIAPQTALDLLVCKLCA